MRVYDAETVDVMLKCEFENSFIVTHVKIRSLSQTINNAMIILWTWWILRYLKIGPLTTHS